MIASLALSLRAMLATERVADRAPGYGMRAARVDGNDVVEVYDAAAAALARVRAGGGPELLEAFTYRMHGHGAHDGQRYVPRAELERWAERVLTAATLAEVLRD